MYSKNWSYTQVTTILTRCSTTLPICAWGGVWHVSYDATLWWWCVFNFRCFHLNAVCPNNISKCH